MEWQEKGNERGISEKKRMRKRKKHERTIKLQRPTIRANLTHLIFSFILFPHIQYPLLSFTLSNLCIYLSIYRSISPLRLSEA